MSFLLDTEHLSAHLRRASGLAHRFFQYSGRLYTSSIALAELDSLFKMLQRLGFSGGLEGRERFPGRLFNSWPEHPGG